MQKYPSKRLTRETKAIIQLDHFLRHEIGLKEELSARELRYLLSTLKAEDKS